MDAANIGLACLETHSPFLHALIDAPPRRQALMFCVVCTLYRLQCQLREPPARLREQTAVLADAAVAGVPAAIFTIIGSAGGSAGGGGGGARSSGWCRSLQLLSTVAVQADAEEPDRLFVAPGTSRLPKWKPKLGAGPPPAIAAYAAQDSRSFF